MQIKGWAHICYLPPFDDQDNYETFQGHVIDEQTKKVYGIKGHWMDYDDPDKNDCMDPQAFYRLVLSDYSSRQSSLVIRREMHNDMATLETDSMDDTRFDQAERTFHFEPTSLLVHDKAYQHCEKYLPALIRDKKNNNEVDDWLVILGTVTFEDTSN
ncbi:hypothetical protein BC941DRAFT_434689 [Chlamydoabsidia padenii]|nr:hypothetical protein BC941DRAFT_434689 [Chlamydoabsidia padenii]